MKQIKFVAIERDGIRDGTYGWEVHLNGEKVIDRVREPSLEDESLDSIFDRLDIEIKFDWE